MFLDSRVNTFSHYVYNIFLDTYNHGRRGIKVVIPPRNVK